MVRKVRLGRRAIPPIYRGPETYFHLYNAATPDVGAVEEIKHEYKRPGVRYLLINPLDQYAEKRQLKRSSPCSWLPILRAHC
jgi:hypothetical protein